MQLSNMSTVARKRDNIFSEKIPIAIVNEVLQSLKFDSIDDTRVFTLKNLDPQLFESSLLLIEPYYIPCKAQKYLHCKLTPLRILTILRQILRSQNYMLTAQEKTVSGTRTMIYQIQPCSKTTDVQTVTFD